MSAELEALFGGTKAGRKRGLAKDLAGPAVPNPLEDVEVTGDMETDSEVILDAIQEGFRSRREREEQRFIDATDSEYWFAVCFKTRAEKDAFLKASGLDRLGDKYLDGANVANVLGVKE